MWWSFNSRPAVSRPVVEDLHLTPDAAMWRERAEQVRAWARRSWDPQIRADLLEIAKCCDRLAAIASNKPALATAE